MRVAFADTSLSNFVGRVAPDRRRGDNVGLDVSWQSLQFPRCLVAPIDLPFLSASRTISSMSLCSALSGRVSI